MFLLGMLSLLSSLSSVGNGLKQDRTETPTESLFSPDFLPLFTDNETDKVADNLMEETQLCRVIPEVYQNVLISYSLLTDLDSFSR